MENKSCVQNEQDKVLADLLFVAFITGYLANNNVMFTNIIYNHETNFAFLCDFLADCIFILMRYKSVHGYQPNLQKAN